MGQLRTSMVRCFVLCSALVVLTSELGATTITLEPTADTYVRGGSYASNNYSQASIVRIKNASNETYDRHALLRFDLTGIQGTVVSAKMYLRCSGLSNGAPAAAFVYSVLDDSWQEGSVTWNTAPPAGGLITQQTAIDSVGGTYQFSVKSFVEEELGGDGVVSFLLRDDLQVAKMLDFDSRESANPPTLVIDVENQYELALTVGGLGSVALSPPGGVYTAGTEVTITATPESGWSFDSWSGDVVGNDNPIVVVMNGDTSVDATFTSGVPGSDQVSFQDDKTGGASASASVSADDMIGVADDLYLAAIATQPFQPVTSVSGLGLVWTLVHEQCSGRGTTGISLWQAQGAPDGLGVVSAQLAAAATDAALVVTRYSGVDAAQPLSLLTSGNSLGVDGSCVGGTDSSTYNLNVVPGQSNSRLVGVLAHLDRTHTPDASWIEHEEKHHGAGVPNASVSLVDRPSDSDTLSLSGSFSAVVDWAAIAVEVHPGVQPTLALTTTGQGSVDLSPPGGSYPTESIVTLTAIPAPGSWFVGWGAGVGGHENPRSVLIEGPVQVSAAFSTTPHHDLDLTVNGTGTIDLQPPGGRYAMGTQVTASVQVWPGWLFIGWSGAATGASPSVSVTMDVDRTLNASFSFVGHPAAGLWASPAELAAAPMSGEDWSQVLAAADASFDPPDVADMNSSDNIECLAAAIVYARTGDTAYRTKVEQALGSLAGLGNPGGLTLAWAREVGAYALAADLVGYNQTALDIWFRAIADTYLGDDNRTLNEMFHERPNNWGAHAFGTLVALYAYLQDDAKLNEVRDYWISGVTQTPSEATFGELWWQEDPAQPRLINPALATRQGLDIDGALADDVRRGGPFAIPPNATGYPWESLQGHLMGARVLERYDPALAIWHVGDKALYRAARLLQVTWDQEFGGWAASGDDRWMLRFFDAAYGTGWSTGHPDESKAGKNTGWPYVLAGSSGPPTSVPEVGPSTSELVPRLYRGTPNPFSEQTTVRFSVSRQIEDLHVRVYDVLGRRVASLFDGPCPPGVHMLDWNGVDRHGRRLASGVYWLQLEAGARRERTRITIVR